MRKHAQTFGAQWNEAQTEEELVKPLLKALDGRSSSSPRKAKGADSSA